MKQSVIFIVIIALLLLACDLVALLPAATQETSGVALPTRRAHPSSNTTAFTGARTGNRPVTPANPGAGCFPILAGARPAGRTDDQMAVVRLRRGAAAGERAG